MLHRNISASERHAPWSWEFANAAARESAIGFVEADCGKLALQLDDVSAWVLKTHSPILWMPIGGSGGGGASPLSKANPYSPCLVKTGAGAVSIKAGTEVGVAGLPVKFINDTAVTMPTLTAGTDYAVWVKSDGTAQASANFSAAPDAGDWTQIGGFHYAPGGNATAQAGGDTTPAINEYSIWDLMWRPTCPDPRGMTLVAGSFWADIYLLGVNHHTDGTSRHGATIADGGSPPKIPTKFGGNGSAAYPTLNWWEAGEVLMSHGKRMPDYAEFAAMAYGVTEGSSDAADSVTTKLSAARTSKWGVMQATGAMWTFGRGSGQGSATWVSNTSGRGSTNMLPAIALFGGAFGSSVSGSRCSSWDNLPTASTTVFAARGVCDHLISL